MPALGEDTMPNRGNPPAVAAYQELLSLLREAATLHGVTNLLAWDQETKMPRKAGEFRAEQTALVTRLAHERSSHPRIGDLLADCENHDDLLQDADIAANLREIRRAYDRMCRLPPDLVEEISRTNSQAIEAWKQARSASDFDLFRPWLERQIELGRRKADCYEIPANGEAYDGLLQDFEPDMTAAEIDDLFRPLRADLIELIGEISQSSSHPSGLTEPLALPIRKQQEFTEFVLRRIGFDTDGGRVDVSTHPFSTSIGPGDTRLTTRYSGDRFLDALSSTLHEAGHALYEQGLPKFRYFGQPLGDCASLGIHESQSLLWENEVGRSRAFWNWALPEVVRHFGAPVDAISVDEVYAATNLVQPGPIRTDSNELSYNLHIMIRFDLERAMIAGDLAVCDLPVTWNDRMRSDLGVEVPDDARGCLQDIHWAMGAIGYFSSYALGNLYAAQFWQAIRSALPDLDEKIARGEFAPLLEWLRDNVHRYGRRFTAPELCRRVTGRPLDHRALIERLRLRLRPIYGIGCPT